MSVEASTVDLLGWVATAVFVGSYFCARPSTLRRVQMTGAVLWTAYGLLRHAPPVVVANLLVLGAAAWTARRDARSPSADQLGGVQGTRGEVAVSPGSGAR